MAQVSNPKTKEDQGKILAPPLTILLLPNYNRKCYQGKYTIGCNNACAPHGDDMDGGTNRTEYNQYNISDHTCYHIYIYIYNYEKVWDFSFK